jgi:hypothetical protein
MRLHFLELIHRSDESSCADFSHLHLEINTGQHDQVFSQALRSLASVTETTYYVRLTSSGLARPEFSEHKNLPKFMSPSGLFEDL